MDVSFAAGGITGYVLRQSTHESALRAPNSTRRGGGVSYGTKNSQVRGREMSRELTLVVQVLRRAKPLRSGRLNLENLVQADLSSNHDTVHVA